MQPQSLIPAVLRLSCSQDRQTELPLPSWLEGFSGRQSGERLAGLTGGGAARRANRAEIRAGTVIDLRTALPKSWRGGVRLNYSEPLIEHPRRQRPPPFAARS